ncbi:exodeoxyribonuclease III [Sediminicola sp. 1XM1-17]|uniref:exodeoxyribonuclease III n=1 Tax=Sediminicola sp. 1XM1-17 TaxID=3127702 RepID=UPI003076A92E
MKLISWNVNGIRAIAKKDFFESLNTLDPDILCLQETKAQDLEVEKTLANCSNYYLYTNSASQKGYSGTAILSREKPMGVTKDMGIEEHDNEGRVLCAEYANYYVVNVYVPNSGQQLERLEYRKKWDADFLNYIKAMEKHKPVIVCGDFNVAHRPIDLKNDKSNYNKTAGYTQVEIDGMDNFINSGLVDTFRKMHPTEIKYSYWSYRFKSRERDVGWRIDYILVSESLSGMVNQASILQNYYGSDHCPIALIM